ASGSATAPDDGIDIDTEGITLAPEEAQILDNQVGLDGGTGIAQSGVAGEVAGNVVEGATTGIEVAGAEALVESNLVEAPAEVGILVSGGFNTLFGNQISGSGGPGISVRGGGPFTLSGTVIGGETEASENVIDGSAEAPIEIFNIKASSNEVGRNRGSGNAGLFIDLVAAPPDPAEIEPGDPNGGIQPPPIALISETGVAGFAEPGAVVRIFRKTTASPGEIASFLGRATADAAGNWSLGFGAPLPAGTNLAATQTLNAGTSELALAVIPAPEAGSGSSTGTSGPRRDRKPPRTRMLKQSRRVEKGRAARFAFTSNEAGSSFQCSLDHAKFKPCSSPKKYRLSRPGKHLFRVRAIDPAGNVDPTPVRRRFEVLG
ncbi:MAG TPA: NosD domain-containing protein, partial [Solirubrobacterales bacterium]|nr:NosD domain-containing protein [Solirubrobacterales bacterium]